MCLEKEIVLLYETECMPLLRVLGGVEHTLGSESARRTLCPSRPFPDGVGPVVVVAHPARTNNDNPKKISFIAETYAL